MPTKTLLSGLALSLLALPAVAAPIATRPVFTPPIMIALPRDSDGIVISVIHPVDYFPLTPGLQPGGIMYTFNGAVIQYAAGPGVMMAGPGVMTSAAGGPTVQMDGATYRVEANGDKVWLRDLATGQRFATERSVAAVAPDAVGLKVTRKSSHWTDADDP